MEKNKKYNIIYADPPWDYGNTKNLDGEFWGMADKHYDVMKFKDICNLPVQNIAADDCYLFLWVTSPFLEKGFEVIKSWGFTELQYERTTTTFEKIVSVDDPELEIIEERKPLDINKL